MATVIDDILSDESLPDGQTRLSRLKDIFKECQNSTQNSRAEAQIDIDYYHDQQWSEAEIKELKRRRQPPVTMNVIKDKVESICGVEEQSDTSPKAWPRTPADEQAAEVATDTLRFVTDNERFDKTRIDVLRDMLICGTGGAIVEVAEGHSGNLDIKIRKLRWETLVFDPFSRETDFSDARYLGSAMWMNADDVVATFGEEAQEAVLSALDDRSLGGDDAGESYSDRPTDVVWSDRKRNRVMVVELYYIDFGIWKRAVFTGGGIISDGESPYRDEGGQPTCPIELSSVYVNRNNDRYGVVRSWRSPQDEINHRRSKALHLINTRQTFRREGSISSSDPQALRRELNKPDGDVIITQKAKWGEDIGIIPSDSEVSGQLEMLVDARTFIDRQGANNALMGRGTEHQSGRAILAQQQAGLQTLATLYSGYNDWTLRIFRQIWARARQFWQAPMWIRVTDDLGSPKFVYVNEPVVDEMGQPVIDPATGQPATQNRIAEMGVDLIVDRVPASANLQDETFKALIELVQTSGLQAVPDVLTAIVASSPIRAQMKRQLIEAIQKPQQPDPMQQQMMQRKGMAEIAKDEAQAANYAASAAKSQVEAQQTGVQVAQQVAAMVPVMTAQSPPMPPPEQPVEQIPDQIQPPPGGFPFPG